ncbi:MAG: recombination protein RecR [Deltaproteobacteria bacterium]|nr:MAG: recombination protein RecR [Deltaproteobacteria bacterium]
MQGYPPSVSELISSLKKLPGIGEKTAERLALYLLKAPEKEGLKLATAIAGLKKNTRFCERCFSLTNTRLCSICSDPKREKTIICIVERPADMAALEKAGSYKGVYHILQGLISPMEGIGPDEIRLKELFQRINTENIKEVIIATGTSVEGEATAGFIAEKLSFFKNIRISRIASGIPMGGDLKYFDQVTLKRAMEKRYEFR